MLLKDMALYCQSRKVWIDWYDEFHDNLRRMIEKREDLLLAVEQLLYYHVNERGGTRDDDTLVLKLYVTGQIMTLIQHHESRGGTLLSCPTLQRWVRIKMFLVLFSIKYDIYLSLNVYPKKETKIFSKSLRLTTVERNFQSHFVVRTPLYFDCLDLFIFLCLPQTG